MALRNGMGGGGVKGIGDQKKQCSGSALADPDPAFFVNADPGPDPGF